MILGCPKQMMTKRDAICSHASKWWPYAAL